MKLAISKNREGTGYYTKIKNDYQGVKSEYIMSLQLPKGNNIEFGTYNVDGFLSCYACKDGTTKPKFVVTNIIDKVEYKAKEQVEPMVEREEDPFATFGGTIEIDNNFLS